MKAIREDNKLSSIPVVIMSAAQDGKEIAEKAGANGYIAKPFDIESLVIKIRELI